MNKSATGSGWIKMKSKYEGKCYICKQRIKQHSTIYWNKNDKSSCHSGCLIYGKVKTAKKDEKPKLDKKGKSPFVAAPVVRGWRDIR